MKKIYKNSIWLLLIVVMLIASCKKFIEIDSPIDKLIPSEVYNTDAGAASVLNGIYSDLTFDGQIATGSASLGFLNGLVSDEITLKANNSNNDWSELYENNQTSISQAPYGIWSSIYSFIFRINSAIKGINSSNTISVAGKKQLLGEAYFLRAFFNFYLVNEFGDIPLILSSNVIENGNAPRVPREQVYLQIISDLTFAKANLNENYLNGDVSVITTERLRPNVPVATALLARVYLYTKQWANAEVEASKLINNVNYKMESLKDVFKTSSKEAIWQLQRTDVRQRIDASHYIPINGGFEKNYFLSTEIFSDFEQNDQRKIVWVYTYTDASGTFNYPAKYRDSSIYSPGDITEFTEVFRLAEQYLIRAEARAYQGKILGANSAKEDLDVIRLRAGLSGTLETTQTGVINAVLQERKLELFTEWGHRWFDLKRTDKIDQQMGTVTASKGGTWQSYKSLFPIPLAEIQKDPALSGHQNPGY